MRGAALCLLAVVWGCGTVEEVPQAEKAPGRMLIVSRQITGGWSSLDIVVLRDSVTGREFLFVGGYKTGIGLVEIKQRREDANQ